MHIKDTLSNFIDKIVEKYPENEAIVFPERNTRYTYKEFQKLYNNIAKCLLELGVKKGDHVAIWSLNCPEWIALQIATVKIGAVLICLNSGYNKKELEYALRHSDSSTLFLNKCYGDTNYLDILLKICPEITSSKKGELISENIPKLKNVIILDECESDKVAYSDNLFYLSELIENIKISDDILSEAGKDLAFDDVINIQYTSGTTGNPKAVMTTNCALINNAVKTGERFGYTENERLLLCLPLFHVMGCILSGILCLSFGATIVLVRRFKTTEVLSVMDKEKCTAINGVPTMFRFMLEHNDFDKYDLSHLNKGMIAGSLCAKSLLSDIVNKMGMTGLTIIYGQTEALSITYLSYDDNNPIATVGYGLDEHVLVKVVDPVTGKEVPDLTEGELWTKTSYLMKGYYKDDVATKKAVDDDGWLHTGDLAIKHKDGSFQIKERIKDTIIRGGENISPLEIEELLNTHSAIKEATVVGVPDKQLGEEICLFIIFKAGQCLHYDEIRNFIKENLARYKVPKYIEVVDTFPTTSSGKIRKFILKNMAIQKYNLIF